MKVSMQQLLSFRASTDRLSRSRLVGVVNEEVRISGQRPVGSRTSTPALTVVASSKTFVPHGFFFTSDPLLSEYPLQSLLSTSIDLREIQLTGKLISQIVRELLQGNGDTVHDPITRLKTMVSRDNSGANKTEHVSAYVTLYNDKFDHMNIYAVMFKPGERVVEIALYKTGSDTTYLAPMPALPFFRDRFDISPLMEAQNEENAGRRHERANGYFGPGAEWLLALHHQTSKAARSKMIGVAVVLAALWYFART